MELPDDKRPAIMDAIYGGASRKIEAIKLVREATGCGLKEAKEFVEKLGDELYAKEPQKFASAPRGKGCVGLLMAGTLFRAGVIATVKILS
jgi:hypothetical protein